MFSAIEAIILYYIVHYKLQITKSFFSNETVYFSLPRKEICFTFPIIFLLVYLLLILWLRKKNKSMLRIEILVSLTSSPALFILWRKYVYVCLYQSERETFLQHGLRNEWCLQRKLLHFWGAFLHLTYRWSKLKPQNSNLKTSYDVILRLHWYFFCLQTLSPFPLWLLKLLAKKKLKKYRLLNRMLNKFWKWLVWRGLQLLNIKPSEYFWNLLYEWYQNLSNGTKKVKVVLANQNRLLHLYYTVLLDQLCYETSNYWFFFQNYNILKSVWFSYSYLIHIHCNSKFLCRVLLF